MIPKYHGLAEQIGAQVVNWLATSLVKSDGFVKSVLEKAAGGVGASVANGKTKSNGKLPEVMDLLSRYITHIHNYLYIYIYVCRL